MAFIRRPEDDEQRLSLLGGTAAPAAAPTPAGAPAAAAPAAAPPKGSGWVNLQRVLNANRAEGDELGSSLAADVERRGAAARGAIDTASADFGAQVRAGQARPDVYTGPDASAFGSGALGADAADAQRRVGALGSQAGRAAMLGERGQPEGYGRTLDAFLSGGAATAAQGPLQQRYGGLESYLSDAQKGAQAQVAGAHAAADRARNAVVAAPGVRPTPAEEVRPPPNPYAATPPPAGGQTGEDFWTWLSRLFNRSTTQSPRG